ncbi:DUF2860 domain-containing protein [Motilimonas pumila]|uniref:DUF2860 domain-containing protein n=1 Tax=Motilimonas pumila TaxID=2303987 RepID=A0A418YAG9_9GAMM|nr:DUF2860 domain-containing protein [Motilimonas pumila]RJG39524.1 DUF2860 domain-containing protein [Motilimonas pumila]
MLNIKSGSVFRFSALACALLSSTTQARPLADEPGFGFTINVNAGYSSKQSQFSTDSDNKQTKDLQNSGETLNEAIVFPLARLSYTLDSKKTQFFLGNSLENVSQGQFQLELGFTHQFANKTQLTMAYFPELPGFSETWEDPYLTGADRKKTDQTSQGARLELKQILGSPFTFKYGYAKNEIDDETSGSSLGLSLNQQQSLVRDADLHRFTGEMFMPIGKGLFFQPSINYTLGDAKGDAMAYDEYGVRLTLTKVSGRHRVTGNLYYAHAKYDANNPVFNKTQKDDKYGAFALYIYDRPFNWDNASFTLLGAAIDSSSNITFYEKSNYSVAMGLAYSF